LPIGRVRFALSAASLAAVDIPTLVIRGGASHPAVQRANVLISESMSNVTHATIDTAADFMIATHPGEVGRLIGQHVHRAEPVFNAAVAVREIAAIGTSHLTT
jgi:cyanophycinase-like exopeptidase